MAGIIIGVIILLFALINIIPPKKNIKSNPFIVDKGETPMVAAHRGGSKSNPENTLLAFKKAVKEIGVDVIETDLYLTRDGFLVCNHNSYIDKTSNVNGDIPFYEVAALCEDIGRRHYIENMTLEELEQYNFGYYFTDKFGYRIYKDVEDIKSAGLQIITVEKMFEAFYTDYPDLKFILEIKNGGEKGIEACRILSGLLEKYPDYKSGVVIGSSKEEVEAELKSNYPDLMRGAAKGSVAKFVITQYLGVNLFDSSDFACLQIPLSYDIGREIPLDKPTLVRRAHRRNIAVQYWTVNNADEMRSLIEMGVDCIMTDDPELLKEIISEYE